MESIIGNDADTPPSCDPPPPPPDGGSSGGGSSPKDQPDNGSQLGDNNLKSNLKDSPRAGNGGSTRGPPSPKGHLHVKFQLENEESTNTGVDSGYLTHSGNTLSKRDQLQSKAVRQLDFEETTEVYPVAKRSTVLERLEKKLSSPDKKKEISELKQHSPASSKVTARVKQIETELVSKCATNDVQKDSESSEKNLILLERPSTPSGSPRIQEGLIKKLEQSKEKSKLGEFKVSAKIHKRTPTPLKAKANESSSAARTEESTLLNVSKGSTGDRTMSRENSGEFQLKRPGSRASSSESLNGSGSGSKTAIEKIIDSRSSSNENITEEKVKQNSEIRRQRRTSGGSSDRNSTIETLTDADTEEDPLSCGLRRRLNNSGSGKRTESGSETDDCSPTSTKENVISIKDRSPSPGPGFVRKGSYRRKHTTSGGSEESDSFRDILPDKRELVPNRRKLSGETHDVDKIKLAAGSSSRSTSGGAVEKSKVRPWARRTASDPNIESDVNVVVGKTGSQPDLSKDVSRQEQSERPSSRIPVKCKPVKQSETSDKAKGDQSPFAMSRVARGRQSERVKVAKKEVSTGKRSSSVGAATRQESSVGAEKPPLAKPLSKTGEKAANKEASGSQKSRSASKEELIRR